MSLGDQSQPVHVQLDNPPTQDPWRTQGQYLDDQRRAQHLYWVAVASVVVSLISGTAAAVSAVAALKTASPGWVLWSNSTAFNRGLQPWHSWAVIGADETRAACDRRRVDVLKIDFETGSAKTWRRETGKLASGIEAVIHTRDDVADEKRVNTWLCLPAGTDPRPRAKDPD